MAEKEKPKYKPRIYVVIYKDELQEVSEETGIEVESVNNRNVREYLGLKPTISRGGKNALIKKELAEKLKVATEDEKEKIEQFLANLKKK